MTTEENINASIPEPTAPDLKRRGRPPKTEAAEKRTPPPTNLDADLVKRLSDRLDAQDKEIAILRDAARQDRLNRADEKIKGKKSIVKVGHLKKLHGQVIVAWLGVDEPGSQAKQELIYQNNNVVGEKLIGHFKTLSGDDIVCDYQEFARSVSLEQYDELEKQGDYVVVRFHNPNLPQSYKINKKFINP